MKLNIGGAILALSLVFVVGLTLAFVIQTSADAVADTAADAPETARQSSAELSSVQQVLGPNAAGNLSILKFSLAEFGGAAAGRAISYTLLYFWDGAEPASKVQITDQFPSQVAISESVPPPTSQQGDSLVWDLGTLGSPGFGSIIITGAVKADVVNGTVFTNTATITGDVTGDDPEDNTAQSVVKIEGAIPDLWLIKWGLLEEMEEGFFFTAEKDVDTTFDLYYFNWSPFASPDTMLIDDLPDGTEYVAADPAPSSINGQQVTWDLGTVAAYGYGEVTLYVRPVQTGTLVNTATITNSIGDRTASDNTNDFQFNVVPLLPPRLLKPNATDSSADHPFIVGANPRFEGLARAGATVTLYEGAAAGCFGDFANCNPVALLSTTVGLDRSWVLTPTTMTETRTYSLYLRSELGGYASAPPFGIWSPMAVRVDPAFTDAGWDMDNFVIETGGQENRPGGLGGSTGTTPNEPFTITIRQDIWDTVPTSPTLSALHDLRLVITEGSDPYTVTLPVTEFRRVPTATVATAQSTGDMLSPLGGWSYDLFYVQHGFGPGARIQVWCLPVYYPDDPNEIPLVGLVWTLCNEILVDPAGYVYDVNTAGQQVDWPAVPPDNALITNATVTATVRSGDNAWVRWEAEKTGQINPQVTDYDTPDKVLVPGYYAFYVPSGQYRVNAAAPHCLPYTSPILTVVDKPIFHNVGMRCTSDAQTGIQYDLFLPILLR